MSTNINFYRGKRHYRSVFREGRYFLATEAQEMQLETLEVIRDQIRNVFGDAAIGDGFKVTVDPDDSGRLLVNPGKAFLRGYAINLVNGVDDLVTLSRAPADFTSSDFIRKAKAIGDDGGISLNFAGLTPVANGNYSIVMELREELITATEDPMLRSANLSEDTTDKHRLVLDLNIVPTSSLVVSPVPYLGTASSNLVNEVEINKSGSTYSVISTTPISGSEAIDGRNLEVVFDNGNGNTTAAFPTSNADLREYAHGKLIDSNGTEFHITNMIVTPGNNTRITMTLDLSKTRPVSAATNQAGPAIVDGLPYKLVKRDAMYTTSASLPDGKVFWRVADVVWGGVSFAATDITDLRENVLAYDAVLDLIMQNNMTFYSDALVTWDAQQDGGRLTWSEPFYINSALTGFEWNIPASNTFALYADDLAVNEVLYVKFDEAPLGGALTLRKGVKGVGDLRIDALRSSKIMWIAKRLSDDRIYFANQQILNDLDSKYFYDVPPRRELPEDILSLGFKASYDEIFENAEDIDFVASTGLFFANSYLMEYSNRSITVSVNNITLASNPSFDVQEGDAIIQGTNVTYVTVVNSPSDFDVEDGSVLSNGNATVSQVMKTVDLTQAGAVAKERLGSYFLAEAIPKSMVIYDDAVIQAPGNSVRVGVSCSNNDTDYTSVIKRPVSVTDDVLQFNFPVDTGTEYYLKFFAVYNIGDGVATLESYRAFMYNRQFVGSIIPAKFSGTSVLGAETNIGPVLPNNDVVSINAFKVVSIGTGGYALADASSVPLANGAIGISITPANIGDPVNLVTFGVLQNAITGLGFSAGEAIYLGLNGDLIDEATVLAFPMGYVQKEVGIALNGNDMLVRIQPLEII
jgi:hypothetical protein